MKFEIITNMLKKIFLLSLIGLTLMGCSHKTDNQFLISGEVDGGKGRTIYLMNANNGDYRPVDSVKIADDGTFEIKGEGYNYPTFYALVLGNDFINVAVDSVTDLKIKANAKNFSASYSFIKADSSNMKMKDITLLTQKADKKIDSLNLLLRRNAISFNNFSDQVMVIVDSLKKVFFRDYILKKPSSAEAYFALFQQNNGLMYFNVYDPVDLSAFNAVATAYDVYYPNSPYTASLKKLALEGIAAKKSNRDASEKTSSLLKTSKVESLPQLKLIDSRGKEQDLSSEVTKSGKVLLVFTSFSADWSPKLVADLRKVSSRGMQIYCVSLDQDRYFWQNAVRTLPWINVSDPMQEGLSKFNVQALPSFFILTSEGVKRINNPLSVL